ncbi:MAG: biotin-dependent carboxyltransferase family protein [Phycisphaerales bacterium]
MSLRVVNVHGIATVQDLGRPGLAHQGVPIGGAADTLSLRVANLAAGNDPGDAAVELAMGELELEATKPCTVVVSSGERPFEPVNLAVGKRVAVRPDDGHCRAYLSVAGGIEVPRVLHSRSTFRSAGLGGVEGRALRAGDVLPIGLPGASCRNIALHVRAMIAFSLQRRLLRIVTDGAEARLPEGLLRISPHGDRVGVRLTRAGGGPARTTGPSRGVLHGTIQAPSAGELVILGPDGPTTGGYATVGTVIAADLPAVGQFVPGQWVGFEPVGRDNAIAVLREREAILASL